MATTFLTRFDYTLVQLGQRFTPIFRSLGELETDLLAERLAGVRIDAPVFVTGLARAGTTMLLNALSQADGVATHRYRDFPFLFTPVAWNWFQDRMRADQAAAVERPHRDRIRITKESAEAFEEPIWQSFFPFTHAAGRLHLLDGSTRNEAFEACFRAHIRKILWLRGGSRYVSKGNYNVARIGYLARLFPTACFIVPVREPVAHVHSLVKQHVLFCRYASEDPRVPRYLAAAGHYEFGPQRRPINLDADSIGAVEAAWRAGDDWRGYARQWALVYAHVRRLCETPGIGERVRVVRYEDACARPQDTLGQVVEFCGLADAGGRVAAVAATLAAPAEPEAPTAAQQVVWSEVQAVAPDFGYFRLPGG